MLIDFKRDEAQKYREHDIQMAQIFANAMMYSYRPPLLPNWSELMMIRIIVSQSPAIHTNTHLRHQCPLHFSQKTGDYLVFWVNFDRY